MRKLCDRILFARAAGSLCALLLLALSSQCVQAQTNDAPKILFLHVRIEKDKGIKLIQSQTRDGQLKPPRNADQSEGIHYDLVTKDGKALWRGVIQNPAERVVEYEDPPRSGKLKKKRIKSDTAEFTIRVPVAADAQRVEFYTLDASPPNRVAQTNKLGSVNVPAK